MITYIKGDLFAANERAIAHGCNCHGFMGAGFAAQIEKRFPHVFMEYLNACRTPERQFYPGCAQPVLAKHDGEATLVYNLGTQNAPGRNARPEYIEAAFRNMKRHMDFIGNKRIAMPLIGADIGGVSWQSTHNTLISVFMLHDTSYEIVVYYFKDELVPEALR